MASIEQRRRSDGGLSARVRWRLGGIRDGQRQVETFSAGTDEQNLARAAGFRKMVEAAGQQWPDGWVKGEGFVRTHTTAATGAGGGVDRYTPPPSFTALVCLARRRIDVLHAMLRHGTLSEERTPAAACGESSGHPPGSGASVAPAAAPHCPEI